MSENRQGQSKSRPTLSLMKEAIDAVREASDDKIDFVRERLEAEAIERDKRSRALYEIAKERADDMAKAMESKDRVIKSLWILLIILVLSVLALAGHAVGLNIPGFGEIEITKE